jgi:hypothetical protein
VFFAPKCFFPISDSDSGVSLIHSLTIASRESCLGIRACFPHASHHGTYIQQPTERERKKKNQETQREATRHETKYNEDDGEEKKIKHQAKRETKRNNQQILEENAVSRPRKQQEEGNKTQRTDTQQNKTKQKKINQNKTK